MFPKKGHDLRRTKLGLLRSCRLRGCGHGQSIGHIIESSDQGEVVTLCLNRGVAKTVDCPTEALLQLSPAGEYELLDLLGRGGMGLVYLAQQRGVERASLIRCSLAWQEATRKHWALSLRGSDASPAPSPKHR